MSNNPPQRSVTQGAARLKEHGHNAEAVAVLRGGSCSPTWGHVFCRAAERRPDDKASASGPLGRSSDRRALC